jgi:hypothetical protein
MDPHREVAAALAAGGVLAYVPLVHDAGRPVKANLSLDAGLLRSHRRSRRASRTDALGLSRQRGTGKDRERGVVISASREIA